ncbi:unnamed protein product, partial [Ixodes persulcatus]
SYVLKESAEYGYFMPNGTGVGLMRLLQTKEIDVIAVPFGLDMYLCAHFHCHPVVRVTDFRILTGMTNPYADNTFAISVGFDHYIWLLIGITLVSISILTVFMERTGIRSTARQTIDYLAPLVMQSSTQRYTKLSTRVIFGSWMIGALVVTLWFQAAICGSLLLQVPSARIDTAYDLLNASHVIPSAAKGVPLLEVMKGSPQEGMRKVYWKIQKYNMELLPETMYSLEFLRSIQEQKRAMMIEMTSIASVQEIMCPRLKGFFYFSKDVVDTLLMSWFTRKDIPANVLRGMDRGTRRIIESGINFMRKEENRFNQFSCTLNSMSRGQDTKFTPLVLRDIQFICIICVGLMSGALVVLAAELLFQPRRTRFSERLDDP